MEMFIEVRGSQAYLFFEKLRGVGGLPLGTQGTVAALIDTPHSLLSAWYLMRRGCKLLFIISDDAFVEDIRSFENNWDVDFPIVSLSDQKTYYSELQDILMKNHASAVVTGHVQLTSDSLSEITRLKNQSGYPVLSPLIGLCEKELHKKIVEVGLSS
ncbi:MAG: hypothetical protein V1726_00805 [Methanobacteriota archaeon]